MGLGSGHLIPLQTIEEIDVHSNSDDVFKTEEIAVHISSDDILKTEEIAVHSNSDDVFKTEDTAVRSNSDDVLKTEETAVHHSSQSFVEETDSGETCHEENSMVVGEILQESENKPKINCFVRAYKSFKCKCLK